MILFLVLLTTQTQAAENYTSGAACTTGNHAFDWDTGWQCVSSAWAHAPLFVGSASAYTCNATNAGLLQWTGSAFQGCNGTSWTSTISQWTTSGSNIYYTTGSVGIGTTSPGSPLQVIATSNTTTGGINLSGGQDNETISLTNTGTGGTTWWLDSSGGGSSWGQGKLLIGVGTAWASPTRHCQVATSGLGRQHLCQRPLWIFEDRL